MNGNLVVNTPKYQMHALAYQGIIVMDSYPQLCSLLRRELGDEYVLLFAEPVTNTLDNSIDWYTPVQGTPRALSELPEDRQNAVRTRLLAMAGEIRRIAQLLQNAQDQSRVVGGHLLELALRYPDDKSLFLVGDQPVFVCWGFGPGTPGAEPQDLSRLTCRPPEPAPKAPAAAPEPAVTPPRSTAPSPAGASWLWWLLPLLLTLALLWVLVTNFGTWPSLSGLTFFHAPLPSQLADTNEQELSNIKEKNTATEQEILALRQSLASLAAQCLPSAPKAAQEPEGDPLVLPKQKEDLSFLEGKWRCKTGLVNVQSKAPLIVDYTFDHSGKGTITIHEPDDVCTGEVTTEFHDGQLLLHAGKSKCQKDTSYKEMEITCTDSNGIAECLGASPSGQQWNAQFSRLR